MRVFTVTAEQLNDIVASACTATLEHQTYPETPFNDETLDFLISMNALTEVTSGNE
jgi:hypothetical protein